MKVNKQQILQMPLWRNWSTHWIQNPAGNHVGSSPTSGTKNKSRNIKIPILLIYIKLQGGARKGRKGKCPVDIW